MVAVQADAEPSERAAGTETGKPPGFRSAAMREHLDEAAALRRFRQHVTAKVSFIN